MAVLDINIDYKKSPHYNFLLFWCHWRSLEPRLQCNFSLLWSRQCTVSVHPADVWVMTKPAAPQHNKSWLNCYCPQSRKCASVSKVPQLKSLWKVQQSWTLTLLAVTLSLLVSQFCRYQAQFVLSADKTALCGLRAVEDTVVTQIKSRDNFILISNFFFSL